MAVIFCGAALLLAGGCSGNKETLPQLLSRAVTCGQQGKWQDCEKLAMEVLKRNPEEPYALLLRALAAEHLGRMDVALESARQAAEKAPEDFPCQYTYGRLLAMKHQAAKTALQVLERALKLRPGNRNTLLLLGLCSSRINSDNAIDYYNQLPAGVKSLPEIQTRIAIYYLDRRDRDRQNITLAYNALRNAHKSAPHNPAIVLNLALFLDHYVQNRNVAVKLYRNYLTLTEHNPELNPTRAQVRARMSSMR